MNNNAHSYDDIIDMPHHVSRKHPHMTEINRAAQFSPFAALTGYEEQIISAQHQRSNRIELSDDEMQAINLTLTSLKLHDKISVVYFFENQGTDGSGGYADGEYIDAAGEIISLIPEYKSLRLLLCDKYIDVCFDDIIAIKLLN